MSQRDDQAVASVYLWQNGMVMTFAADGQQIPDLQGPHTAELVEAIEARATPFTVWNGFSPAGPCEWRRGEWRRGEHQ